MQCPHCRAFLATNAWACPWCGHSFTNRINRPIGNISFGIGMFLGILALPFIPSEPFLAIVLEVGAALFIMAAFGNWWFANR